MARTAKRFARAFGFEIKKYSITNRAIDILAAEGRPLFFIQIGANNGIDFDDVYTAIVQNRVAGIAVEPITDYFASLRHAYAYHPYVRPVQAALHPTQKSMTMYRIRPERAEEAWQHGLASFSREHLISHKVDPGDILAEEVDCMNFDELVENYVPEDQSVDVLLIDTEGFDDQILAMVDLDRIKPSIVRFEAKHMDPQTLERFAAEFRRRGYSIHLNAEDCIALAANISPKPWDYFLKTR